jgi:hypothetical protein
MSENLELVHAILAEWERGDFRSVDWAHPQIEYAIVDDPGSRVGWGVATMTRTWREFLTAWDSYRVEAREYRELDEQRGLVALRAYGRGRRADSTAAQREAAEGAPTSFTFRPAKSYG